MLGFQQQHFTAEPRAARGCEQSPAGRPGICNVISDQQTLAHRVEIWVYSPFLSLQPRGTVSKELSNIQPKLQPSLGMALPWSLGAAARGQVLFGASPVRYSHHLRFTFTTLGLSPPRVLAALLVALDFAQGDAIPCPLLRSSFLPPQFQTRIFPLFTEDSFVPCLTTGQFSMQRGWRI